MKCSVRTMKNVKCFAAVFSKRKSRFQPLQKQSLLVCFGDEAFGDGACSRDSGVISAAA